MTKSFVKIYDLAEDTLSPVFFINQIEDANGFNMMTSMTIEKSQLTRESGINCCRIYVGTDNGTIYSYLLNTNENSPENNSLYLVEDLQLVTDIDEIANKTTKAVVSLHYSTSMELLFISYECGIIMFGRPTMSSAGLVTLENPIHLDPKKLAQNSQTNATFWTKSCGYAVNWQDMGIQTKTSDHSDAKISTGVISFCSIKEDNWMPVLLEISRKEIQIHVYKNQTRTVGLSYVRDVSSNSHIDKFFVANDTGSISLFPLPSVSSSGVPDSAALPDDIVKKYFTLDKLPQAVKMNTEVFEGCPELSTYDYDSIFYYTGEFKTQLGTGKSTINVYRPNTEPIIRCGNKGSVKMTAKLDNLTPDKPNNDILLTGFRVALPPCEDMYSIKLFNRTIKMPDNQKILEVGF